MPIQIHWGSPGSYKTSGAIQDVFIKEILSGRPIVTNVRGLNIQKVYQIFGKQSFLGKHLFKRKDIEYSPKQYFKTLDFGSGVSVNEDVIELLRYFWLWIPTNTFFFIDEAQLIYPAKETDFKISNYEADDFIKLPAKTPEHKGKMLVDLVVDEITPFLEEGQTVREYIAERASRIRNLRSAFDMHRHYNFDMIFTMPDIKQISRYIRGVSEFAWFHRNQATIGLRGFYLEIGHEANNNGNGSDGISVRNRRIDKRIFKVYESTATGKFRDTAAGTNIFTSFRFLAIVGFLAVVLLLLVRNRMATQDDELRSGDSNQVATEATVGEVSQTPNSVSQVSVVEHSQNTAQHTSKTPAVSARTPSDSFGSEVYPFLDRIKRDLEKERLYVNAIHVRSPFYTVSKWFVSGFIIYGGEINYSFELHFPDGSIVVPTYKEMEILGYSVIRRAFCLYEIQYRRNLLTYAVCPPSQKELEEREDKKDRVAKNLP